MAPQSSAYRMAAAIWGAMGLVALLGYAIVRLASVVADGMGHHWGWQHIAVAAGNTAFMAWSEGYRGFQLRFSPRSAARVKWLAEHANAMQTLLAPLFVMGYFGTTRRRMMGVYVLTVFILAAIAVIHGLAQPWRAALDIGVVVGLAWGLVTFLAALWRTLNTAGFVVSPEVAEDNAATDHRASSAMMSSTDTPSDSAT